MTEVGCSNCGDTIEVDDPDEQENFFCSRECYYEYLSDPKETHPAEGTHRLSGENHRLYGVTGEDHPAHGHEHTEEAKEKIGKASKGNTRGGGRRRSVEETGNIVSSGWEAEIDKLLFTLGIDYDYEGRTFEFEDGRTYTPDFDLGDTVIEVKGHVYHDWERERAERLLEEFPEITYVAIIDSSEEIPADVVIPFEDHDMVTEVLV
jgi:hypothetical protein